MSIYTRSMQNEREVMNLPANVETCSGPDGGCQEVVLFKFRLGSAGGE